uniref:Reverse transcriptase/retrotransposon-derived protein RNase H-like domain-containing protein n=1 Tax=Electrophorus electricus TaxID=8005 RepID=A0AAY5EE29_ELEEL
MQQEKSQRAGNNMPSLKSSICSASTLGLPNYSLPLNLYTFEHDGATAGELAPEHGGGYRPVAYLSKALDNVAHGLSACLHAKAAAAIIVQDTILHRP